VAIVVCGEHRGVAKRKDVFEYRFVGLNGTCTLRPRLQPSPQHQALTFGAIKPRVEQVALAIAVCQLGIQPPATWQPGDEVT
jgi:hypothetical protein